MAVGIVSEVKFNVSKTSKNGKSYTVTQLTYFSESGGKKTENCFSDCEYADVLKSLAPGDKIEAKYTKNGEFFNLVDVKLLEKGDGVAPSFGLPPKQVAQSFGKNDPSIQAAIIRQNALTNAVTFVTSDTYWKSAVKDPKTPPPADFLADVIVNMAKKFEHYTSGQEVVKNLLGTVPDSGTPLIPE